MVSGAYSSAELVEGFAIFPCHAGDLTGESVAHGVEAGGGFAGCGGGTGGVLGVGAVGVDLGGGCHKGDASRLKAYHEEKRSL